MLNIFLKHENPCFLFSKTRMRNFGIRKPKNLFNSMMQIHAGNSMVYQQQQQYGSGTRNARGSPSPSRPASTSSAASQWQSTIPAPGEAFFPRQENWSSEVYGKRSVTPTWTELGVQLEGRNPSWERQSNCYQKKGSPSSWNTEYTSKRPSSATGVSPWSEMSVGYQQQRRGSLQLWQFLVTLLDDPANAPCIAWTGRGMEFKLIEPEEVDCIAIINLMLLNLYFYDHCPKNMKPKCIQIYLSIRHNVYFPFQYFPRYSIFTFFFL